MTTSVTINLPVTVKFDGCFCSEECEHIDTGECHAQHGGFDLLEYDFNRDTCVRNYIRTRWCCETFGMGDEQAAQPEVTEDYELETMDANYAEALRRMTSE